MENSPFTVHGDETLEARIVAWVLGEASAFEAAELERLCEERPELLVFRRRMRALHGLLTEAEAAQPDEGWKLPVEKRKVLDEIFGGQQPIRLEVEKEKRIRHSGRKALLAIAACLMLALLIMRLMPWKQVAEAEITLEVKSRTSGMSPLGAQMSEVSGANRSTPNFFGTEFEKIKSRNSLEKVVDNLDLAERWGVDKETALRRVKSSIKTENIRGTDLVSIRVQDPNQTDARDIADEVAKTYKAYRQESESQNADRMRHELNKAVRDQEDKVEERRKALATIERNKGSKPNPNEEAIKRGLDAQDFADARREYETDQELLQTMKLKLIGEDISGKMPRDSVEVHDQPVIASKKISVLDAAASGVKNWFSKSDTLPSEMAGEKKVDFMPSAPAGGVSESLANQKRRTKLALAPERARTNSPRVMAEGAQADLGALAADDSLKSIKGVATFESKGASGGLAGGSGSGSSFGLQANQPPAAAAPPPPPVSSPAPAAKAKVSKDMAAADTPVLPESPIAKRREADAFAAKGPAETPALLDMDLAKLQAAGISESPGQARTTFTGGGAFGGGEGVPFAEPATAATSSLDRKSSELDMIVPPPTLGRRFGEQPADNLPGVVAGQTLSWAGKKMEAAEKIPVLGDRVTAADEETVREVTATIETRSSGIAPPGQPKPATAVTAGAMTLEGGTVSRPSESQLQVARQDESGRKDEMLRTNPALTQEHAANVDQVRRSLHTAEGNYNLGKYDDAKKEYENTLRQDPYNAAARRGLERIASAKSDYHRAAYDHTRAELLSQVDKAWDLSVPAEEMSRNKGVKAGEETTVLADGATKADAFFDTSKVAETAKDAGSAGYEIQTGKSREYAFKGKDLSDSESLRKAIQDQEDKVEERRKVLATIVRTKGIIYKGTDSFYGQSGVDEDQGAKNALDTFHQLEQEKMQLESQISSLLKYDNDQLMVYAAGLDLPDNIVRNLLPLYQQAKRDLNSVDAEKHPTLAAEQVEALKRQLDEGVVNLRATLKAKLDLATESLKSVEAMKDETREEAIKRGLDAQDYVDAKREFEEDQARLQQLKQKLHGTPAKAKPEPPKVDLTKLMEEIAATEDPYSTFSLNISDASFQVAQAALAKGERPDPAGIKVEQFYNAVDYGDPAPSAGEPVAVNIEQSAHPVIPSRNLVRVALKTSAAGRSAAQPLRLTLLVDQSGSMVREDRRAAMDKALAGLAGLLTDKDLVTVVGFSRTPRLLADGMPGDKAGKLAELVNQAASEGGTNLEEAIKLGEQMADRRKLAGAQNRIVLFTDGAANLGNADPSRLAEKVKQLRQKGIAFDIAGIAADGLNDELLGELARNGNGRYYVVGKGADDNLAKQLAGAFRPAAENVKVQVRFNPERVGRYKLIGFEKDRLKTEDFRNDAVDAAELAAEEAGVAVYQVEPLPGGNGELGEVSVRFRDAASAQMVERAWTIPHDDKAPAFDRAAPSMQLAVLSMLAAEKLKGGPLGDAIDFKQLAEPRANVKRFYGTNGRVGEVLNMVDALK